MKFDVNSVKFVPSEELSVVPEELETTLIELLQTRLAKGETLVYLDTKADLWKLKKGGSRVQQMNIDQLRVCIDELSSKKY